MSPVTFRGGWRISFRGEIAYQKKKNTRNRQYLVFTNELESSSQHAVMYTEMCPLSSLLQLYPQDNNNTVECNTITTAVAHLVIACLQPTLSISHYQQQSTPVYFMTQICMLFY